VNIEGRVAEILSRHMLYMFPLGATHTCSCGYDGPHSEHVAAVLVAELGVAQEVHTNPDRFGLP
jgi:hypothetical protein